MPEGIGEWETIRKARPKFEGHRQPRVPAWGYEDESDPAAMAKKIDAAADHGIDVFLFDWYYNAAGTFLERALNEGYLKAANNGRVKFALMWANHNLRTGKGAIPRPVFDKLVEHVVADYFTHPSYWKPDGKAYFSIYDFGLFLEGLGGIEGAAKAIEHLRARARAAGLPGMHLNVIDWKVRHNKDAVKLLERLGADSVTSYVWVHLVPLKDFPQTAYDHVEQQYLAYWDRAATAYGVPYYPNATMGWDPTPRIPPDKPHTGRRYPDTPVLSGNTPARFKQSLERIKARLLKSPPAQRIVTVNAWNEWTEGSYLEPDTVHGMAYLEAIRDALGK
jgi:hypothetical protein